MCISKQISFIAILLCAISCNRTPSDGDGDVQKTYFADGVLHWEIHYKNGVKDGVSKEFYNNGQLFEEVPYKNNKREGLVKRFYDNGVLSQETPYENDKIHGVQKRYRQSGNLMYEAPFHYGKECVGLKEYTLDDKLKVNYPTIVITPIDNSRINGNYKLRISLSDNSTAVDYSIGNLVDEKCLTEADFLPKEKGVAVVSYQLAMGESKTEDLTIVAKIKTPQGNYYITTTKFHLAIEYR